MILKASQRGGPQQLARHLTQGEENEHIEVYDVRHYVSNTPEGALKEAQAIARGTRCKKHLFHISFNPPQDRNVSDAQFESAFTRVEKEFGLEKQGRVIVFHEKHGRRHAHAVYDRIDAERMKAIPLNYYKNRLQDISRQIHYEHNWPLPNGLRDKNSRDPRNFTLNEWQAAKRTDRTAKELKSDMQQAWNTSDTKETFTRALEDKGLFLARGDRRGFVAVTYEGEVFSLSKFTAKKTKELEARLGKPETLRSIPETKSHIATFMIPQLRRYRDEALAKEKRDMEPLKKERQAMTARH